MMGYTIVRHSLGSLTTSMFELRPAGSTVTTPSLPDGAKSIYSFINMLDSDYMRVLSS